MNWQKILALIIGSFLLESACVTKSETKDVVADKRGYLEKNFSQKKLGESQKKWMKQNLEKESKVGFHELVVTIDRQATTSGGTVMNLKSEQILVNAGHGLVKSLWEVSNNEIPFSMDYSLSYRGLIPLLSQDVLMSRRMANSIVEIKQFSQFPDMGSPKENQKYEFEYTVGGKVQVVNFAKISFKCQSGHFFLGSTIHPKFEGQALDLTCESFRDGVLKGKSKFVYFLKYGVALSTEFNDSSMKRTDKIRTVEFKTKDSDEE